MTDQDNTKLRRTLGFWALTAYGIGDILGAGIYALVGEIAAVAGHAAWLSFGVSMAIAALTAVSYAELAGRYPHAAAEAVFCQKAFRRPSIAIVIGWLVFCSGLVSLSAVTRAMAGYVHGMATGVPEWLLIPGFILVLAGINFWGIRQSSTTNIVCTVIEASGLLFVLTVGVVFLAGGRADSAQTAITAGETLSVSWIAIAQGGAVAFFAFIGFQEMANVAEEVKEPNKNFPAAILTALGVAGVIYISVVYVATSVVPPAELAGSKAPLLEVVRTAAPAVPDWTFTLVALFAVANTGLLNFIMASRLLYGMAGLQMLPRWLHTVHPATRTPHRSILLIGAVALLLAFTGTLGHLAATTAVLLLAVFAVVNTALVVIKWRYPEKEGFKAPLPIPALGALTSLILIFFVQGASLVSALVLLALGLALVAWRTLRAGRFEEEDIRTE